MSFLRYKFSNFFHDICKAMAGLLLLSSSTIASSAEPKLYLAPYAHLDTQWLWAYDKTITEYLKNTLDDNFARMNTYPDYQFNFTGAFRYKLIQQYWPARFEQLKARIAEGRWHVAGSMWDEADVMMPAPESVLRHILYGNLYFSEQFHKTSEDFMIPDSFGYPASLPTVISHAGLKGFSTQKLSWGAARGIPFNIGLWQGPDGSEVLSALNPGAYESAIPADLSHHEEWITRLNQNPRIKDAAVDFRYYGIGDQGGAPRIDDIKHLEAGLHDASKPFLISAGASDQLFRDAAGADLSGLPRTDGEFLLTEHSAGVLTSNSAIKNANRRSEHLARDAEYLASLAKVLGQPYPKDKLRTAWETFLPAQMHDIMSGTAIPRAIHYSLADHALAQNLMHSVIESSAGVLAAQMDTSGEGQALLIVNSTGAVRNDLARFKISPQGPAFTHVQIPDGKILPVQKLQSEPNTVIFPVHLEPHQNAIYHLIVQANTSPHEGGVATTERSLESDLLRVTLDSSGDVASIFNKATGQEELKSPIRYQFLDEYPTKYPSWNMTWKDRKRPPRRYLTAKPLIEVLEQGFYQSAIRVTREQEGSKFVQTFRVTQGRPILDVTEDIDWHTHNSSLKVAISPVITYPLTDYDMGLSVATRPENSAKLFEMPVHEWIDRSAKGRGISLLDACCYGSDAPHDGSLRLTLLYTPHARTEEFRYNAEQDQGLHTLKWSLYPHTGSWREAGTEALADQLNSPLLVFAVPEASTGAGPLGKTYSFINAEGVKLQAIKEEEKGLRLIVRVADRDGSAKKFKVSLPAPIHGLWSVNGQEQNLKPHKFEEMSFEDSVETYGLKTYALTFATEIAPPFTSRIVPLSYNAKAFSNRDRSVAATGDFAAISFPNEEFTTRIVDRGVLFDLAPHTGAKADVVKASGQQLELPKGRALHLLAFASKDHDVTLEIDGKKHTIHLNKWHGAMEGKSPIAAFAHYTHGKTGNLVYHAGALFHYEIPSGRYLTLPSDGDFYIAAISVANDKPVAAVQQEAL